MTPDHIKAKLDALRAEASRGPVPSSVVFTLTDPIMDHLMRQPTVHACCGYPMSGEHNASCTFYGKDTMLRIIEEDHTFNRRVPTPEGECPNCGHEPLENRVVAWARDPDGEHVEEAFCPECGWSTG